MILIVNTDRQKAILLKKNLLKIGILAELSTLKNIPTLVDARQGLTAVVYVGVSPTAPQRAVMTFLHNRYPLLPQGFLTIENEIIDATVRESFDFVLPITAKPAMIAQTIAVTNIRIARRDPTDRVVGALRFRLADGAF